LLHRLQLSIMASMIFSTNSEIDGKHIILEGSSGITQTEKHPKVCEGTVGICECRFLLVTWVDRGLEAT